MWASSSGTVQLQSTYILWVDGLYESLEYRHPAGREVTVLEEDPTSALHGNAHQGLSSRALR